MSHAIILGDVLATLRELPDNSIDGLLCDPPYGFRFMGKTWDYDVPSVEVWREALRVLKPGASLLAFGGARTYHRVAIGIEDAGFELRDCLMWLYGKGFPKSQNIGLAIDKAAGAERRVIGTGAANCEYIARGEPCPGHGDVGRYGETVHAPATAPTTELAQQWDGYGTALKPAWEPIILARKPLDGTTAANVARWGVGGLAIDACRIGDAGGTAKGSFPKGPSKSAYGDGLNGGCEVIALDGGRWPANLVLDPEAGAILDGAVGNRPSRKSVTRNGGGGKIFNRADGQGAKPDGGYTDDGGPSRFFYCAKVSTREREYGCDALPRKSAGECTDRDDGSEGLSSPRAGAGRGGGARNHHPTLKPLALTRWLASLIKPPTADATLLVPYAGTGSEMIGALQAGWPVVLGIEGEAEYVEIANARIPAWTEKAA